MLQNELTKDERKKIVAMRIKTLRATYEITQQELAKVIGKQKGNDISVYERGLRIPNDEEAKAMSLYFGESIEYIQGFEPSEEELKEIRKNLKPIILPKKKDKHLSNAHEEKPLIVEEKDLIINEPVYEPVDEFKEDNVKDITINAPLIENEPEKEEIEENNSPVEENKNYTYTQWTPLPNSTMHASTYIPYTAPITPAKNDNQKKITIEIPLTDGKNIKIVIE